MTLKRKAKVLIVDDTPENLHVLVETLQGDYAVVAARDGERALALARVTPQPDVILLDIMMPGMDGYEVCLRLKADPVTWSIPVLFITALHATDSEERGLTVGALDYILKPFSPAVVKARVRSHIELKQHKDLLEELVAERTRELSQTQDATIQALATLAEARDPETGGHILRTRNYVRLLALHMQNHPRFAHFLTLPNIDLLHKSAPLHDVGKVGVPDHILLKPGKLTDDEFRLMKKHCGYGMKALAAAEKSLGENSFLRLAKEIAFTHHEKWDGSGYPKGLSGENIPISGRLMAIADVYDALISKRVYKPPFSHEKAVSIITGDSGTHFDPDLVEGFVAIQESFRQTAIEHADYEEERENLSRK